MRIGELAERSGVSTKTLRYYEEIGVLPPPERASNGYRVYDMSSVGRLRFVRAAQAVGLTLGEIRGVLAFRDEGETPCAHVADLIAQRARQVSAHIEELESMRRELVRLERRARRLDPGDCDPAQICHVIPTGA